MLKCLGQFPVPPFTPVYLSCCHLCNPFFALQAVFNARCVRGELWRAHVWWFIGCTAGEQLGVGGDARLSPSLRCAIGVPSELARCLVKGSSTLVFQRCTRQCCIRASRRWLLQGS